MDTSITPVNASTNSVSNEQNDKYAQKMKELVKNNSFDKFDLDNDGKISGIELTKLKQVFNSVNFDVDDENAVDESAFNDALSDYKE